MFKKREFLHWYLSEGMNEQEFLESQDNLLSLENDYKKIQ